MTALSMVIPLIVGFAAALAPSRIFRPTVQVYGVNVIKKSRILC